MTLQPVRDQVLLEVHLQTFMVQWNRHQFLEMSDLLHPLSNFHCVISTLILSYLLEDFIHWKSRYKALCDMFCIFLTCSHLFLHFNKWKRILILHCLRVAAVFWKISFGHMPRNRANDWFTCMLSLQGCLGISTSNPGKHYDCCHLCIYFYYVYTVVRTEYFHRKNKT